MLQYGVANENIRKIWSKYDSAASTAKDVLLANKQSALKMKMDKVLRGNGPFFSYNMADFTYHIRLAKAEDIMVAQSGEAVEGYKLENLNLEFEVIEGKIAKETKAYGLIALTC